MANKTKKEEKNISQIARQVKRAVTLNRRKQAIEKLPACPTLLSLNELSHKTGLPYLFLRKMIVEEKQIAYIRVGKKVCINYEMFLSKLNGEEV